MKRIGGIILVSFLAMPLLGDEEDVAPLYSIVATLQLPDPYGKSELSVRCSNHENDPKSKILTVILKTHKGTIAIPSKEFEDVSTPHISSIKVTYGPTYKDKTDVYIRIPFGALLDPSTSPIGKLYSEKVITIEDGKARY